MALGSLASLFINDSRPQPPGLTLAPLRDFSDIAGDIGPLAGGINNTLLSQFGGNAPQLAQMLTNILATQAPQNANIFLNNLAQTLPQAAQIQADTFRQVNPQAVGLEQDLLTRAREDLARGGQLNPQEQNFVEQQAQSLNSTQGIGGSASAAARTIGSQIGAMFNRGLQRFQQGKSALAGVPSVSTAATIGVPGPQSPNVSGLLQQIGPGQLLSGALNREALNVQRFGGFNNALLNRFQVDPNTSGLNTLDKLLGFDASVAGLVGGLGASGAFSGGGGSSFNRFGPTLETLNFARPG